jgi:PAS domain S-box-containing protein
MAFLVQLGDALRSLTDTTEMTAIATDMLARHLNCERCVFVEFQEPTDFALVPSTLSSETGVTNAFISTPVLKKGACVAALTVSARTPRLWRADEIELIKLVANRCWESIERVRVEQELKTNERRYRSFLGTISSIVWTTDSVGAIVDTNPSWLKFTGQTLEEGINWGWLNAIHPDDREHTARVWGEALVSKNLYETQYRLRRHDGKYRLMSVRGAPVINDDGSIAEWVGTCTDITDDSEHRLRAAYSLLEFVTAGSEDAIAAIDLSFRYTAVNTAYRREIKRLIGVDVEVGSTVTGALRPNKPLCDAALQRWARALRGETVVETNRFVDLKGACRSYEQRYYPIRDTNDQLIGAGQIAREVTDRVENEARRERLLQHEQMARAEAERVGRMKDEFLATLSHELRTPLNAITGWSQILLSENMRPDEISQAVEVIHRNAVAQKQLIEDLLDMSRIASGKVRLELQVMDVAMAVSSAIESVKPTADAKDIVLYVTMDPLIGMITGDPVRLQQVLWNLLSNAIKFTHRGGRVSVELRAIENSLEIEVKDSGIGIKPEFLPFVFDRFAQADGTTTRRYGGLGIGLSIVKQLVEMHNGSVSVKSLGPNLGTTFVVTLPLPESHPLAADGANFA